MRIPTSYTPARLRGVLPMDQHTGLQGVAFDLPSGEVLRLVLDEKSAADLSNLLREYQISAGSRAISQSSASSGSSHSDGSPQSGQKVVPVTKSSKAEAGDA